MRSFYSVLFLLIYVVVAVSPVASVDFYHYKMSLLLLSLSSGGAVLDPNNYHSNCNPKNYDQDLLKQRFDSSVAGFRVDNLSSQEWMSRFHPRINKIHVAGAMMAGTRLALGSKRDWEYLVILDAFVNNHSVILVTSAYMFSHRRTVSISHRHFALHLGKSSLPPVKVIDSGNEKWTRSDRNKPVVLIFSSDVLSRTIAEHLSARRTAIDMKISFDGGEGRHSKSFTLPLHSTWPMGRPQELVSVVMVGSDITAQELVTHISYYRLIGFQHIFLYFLIPLHCLSNSEVNQLNELAMSTNYSFTIIQWHPYCIDDPLHTRMRSTKEPHVGLTELYLIASSLYRLKNSVADTWIAHVDVDDYMVPDSKYATLRDMVYLRRKGCMVLYFHNSYFFLVRHGSNNTDPGNVLPANFTFPQLLASDIVREKNLELHAYRPKMLYSSADAIDVGIHSIRQPVGRYPYHCPSHSYYLHHIKTTREHRDHSLIREREVTNMSALLHPSIRAVGNGNTLWIQGTSR